MTSADPAPVRVTFEPGCLCVTVERGRSLLEAAREGGISLRSECGGGRACGSCRIEVPAHAEAEGWVNPSCPDEAALPLPRPGSGRVSRLACRTQALGDVEVAVPAESVEVRHAPGKRDAGRAVPVRPALAEVPLQLERNSRSVRPLARRLADALPTKGAGGERPSLPLAVVAEFSRDWMRRGGDRGTALVRGGREVLRVHAGDASGICGLALDLGTTSLAAVLCDLRTGEILGRHVVRNPQGEHGADVMARIAFVQRDPENLFRLQTLVASGVHALVAETARQAGVDPRRVADLCAVGNPTMVHLFVGADPRSLAGAPFTPLFLDASDVSARTLGLDVHPDAAVHLPPILSGYVGSDALAAFASAVAPETTRTTLVVDVGTNGEILLVKGGRIWATSCATGPAFEGAQISSGVVAGPGAVERVELDRETDGLSCFAIGGPKNRPLGLCGSGVISAVSALLDAGVLARSGAIVRGERPRLVVQTGADAVEEVVLVAAPESGTGRDVVLTQKDIRAVQLGKAALRAGIEILMKEAGVPKLERVLLAGAFGSHIDPLNALNLGLLPPLAPAGVIPVGNAALDGARMALLDVEFRERLVALAGQVEVVPLPTRADFQQVFVSALGF